MRDNFRHERGDFRSEMVDLGLLWLISGLKEPDLGLNGLGGTYVWTDIRKFTPVSYRTSAHVIYCYSRDTSIQISSHLAICKY